MLLLDRSGTTAPRASERRVTALVLGAALLVMLGARLLYLHVPLGIDEGGVAWIAKAWGTGGHGSIYGAYWLDRPPLLVALYKLAVYGGDVGVRLLGALAAAGLVTLTTLVARAVAGDRAARLAAVLSAAMAGSVALAAVYTPAELLASVPACGSILCLLAAGRRGQLRWFAAAGFLAVTAVLVKQSFLDAGFAGAVFLAWTIARGWRGGLRSAGAYAAGALVSIAAVGVWLAVAHVAPGTLVYALFGFRVHALQVLSASQAPLHVRLHTLLAPGALSGMFVVLLIAPAGLRALARRDRATAVTFGAWLAAGCFGVLAGGSYWPHYLIQLVAPACVLTGAALARVRPLRGKAVAGALATLAIVGSVVAEPSKATIQQRGGVLSAANYLRAHARPGDTQYVLYARANVDYYAGLPSPFPFAWSLIIRAYPGATTRLLHLLDSPQRPTWIVGWQGPGWWGLDPHHAIAHALKRQYRLAARVDGHPIYHRRSPSP